jgi:membrane protease YdiL (CAAX protease family)
MTPTRKLNAWFALWLVLGYVFAMLAGSVLVGLFWGMGIGVESALHGGKIPAHLQPGTQVLAWSITFGMLLGVAWVLLFTLHHAKPWLRGANATDVAWRAPTRRDSYAVAILIAGALVVLVGVVQHFLPPDLNQLTGPMQQLSASHGLPYILFVLVAVVIAPPAEEFIFRGAGFAGVARSFGTGAAVIVTTLAFVVLHAADKIHYWPGFLLVGCLALAAVFLRLRYRSLWPGILLHVCYNGFLILLS